MRAAAATGDEVRIRLVPWVRPFRARGAAWLEGVLAERSVPLEPLLYDVVRALARGPVASSSELQSRLGLDDAARPALHGCLSTLKNLGAIEVGPVVVDPDAARAALLRALAERTPPLPLIDQVELTNVCPMQCTMCPTGTGRMARPKGMMARAVFDRLVDEIAAAGSQSHKPLTLHNLGESLLHKELPSFVARAKAAGLTTELSANPGHLPLALYRTLVDAGLDRLVLSLDGTDAETLTAIRGAGAKAGEAFANVDALLDERRRTGARTPALLVQMIRQRRNAEQAAAFLARYGSLGLDGVAAVVKELDANTVDDGDALYEIGRPRRPYLCRAPWRTVVVLWNGDVVPCCHDANGELVLGNLGEQSLRDIWHGPRAERLRAELFSSTSGPCAGCAHRADRYALPAFPEPRGDTPLPERLDDLPDEPLHW